MSISLPLCLLSLFAAPPFVDEQERLEFLVGVWHTQSTWPDTGETADGDLRYEWVLGGAWLKVTFRGNRASGKVWEAHGMIRHDPDRNLYESIVFFSPDGPETMIGHWLTPQTIRFEFTQKDQTYGIDYTRKQDGSVYQENWAEAGGERKITLRTIYSAAK